MIHGTPRMHDRPHDPAYDMLKDHLVTTPRVKREGCYICEDMEFARMGLPLCSPCCKCRTGGFDGHIAADAGVCDDCDHDMCEGCAEAPAQEDDICSCSMPCCEVDVGIGVNMTCGSTHCPTHGYQGE